MICLACEKDIAPGEAKRVAMGKSVREARKQGLLSESRVEYEHDACHED